LSTTPDTTRVAVEKRGHLLLIGLDRAAKRNAFDGQMMVALSDAFGTLESDPDVRCGVLYANGGDFTGGVNLPEYAELWSRGENPLGVKPGAADPMGLYGGARRKPVVSAVRGRCYTIGIELILNTDVRVAAEDTRFAQMEVQRGLYPVGGATLRFVHETGYGNAMRHLLTGDEFSAAEALRIGLVQEVVAPGKDVERAIEIASRIAEMAPVAVAATRESARIGMEESFRLGVERLIPDLVEVYKSEDAWEGVASFKERRSAHFSGR
jgi:enoyl-CoA hydratase/carnithine racemase